MSKNRRKSDQQKAKISGGDSNHVIRRSITVDDRVNAYINKFRARLLEDNKEYDFTNVINMLAELGAYRLSNNEGDFDQEEADIISKYLEGASELKIEGAADEAWTRWLSYQFPESDAGKKSIRSGVKGKKRADIPEQE